MARKLNRQLVSNLRQMLRNHPGASDSVLAEFAESGGFSETEIARAVCAARKPKKQKSKKRGSR